MIANLNTRENSIQTTNYQQFEKIHSAPNNKIPPDLIVMIFSNLGLATLGVASCVNMEWKKLLEDHRNLWKIAIYRELAFGNDKWARCFGEEVIAGEPPGEDFATLPFEEVIKDYRNIVKGFPGKKAREVLMLVRVPKTLNGELTLRSLGALAARCSLGEQTNTTGYRFIFGAIFAQEGNKTINTSHWVLMTKDILPGTQDKRYPEQQELVNALTRFGLNGYEVPRLLETAVCILAEYFISYNPNNPELARYLFKGSSYTWTRCQENVNGYQVDIGGFVPSGFRVIYLHCSEDIVGVAPLREL